MLGKFLEISIHTPSALESLEFYQRLGFTQAAVGETWAHPYAVITDGRLFIGLHEYEFESPSLTYVKPDLLHHLPELEALGIEFAFRKLGDNVFNEAGFHDPDRLMVTLIEARTFSPPDRGPSEISLCGYFAELGRPIRDLQRAKQFWEQLGFVGTAEESAPFRRLTLTSDRLDLGLYPSGEIKRPVLTFIDPEMPTRIARLLNMGIEPSKRLPPSLDPDTSALILAPEGTPLLLLTGDV